MICKNKDCKYYKNRCVIMDNYQHLCKNFILDKKDDFYYIISFPVDIEVYITINDKKYPMGVFYDLCRDGKLNAKCQIENL